MNKNLWIFVLFCAFFAPIGSVADDLAGVMSIETATNSIIELEMPFAPIEKTGPQGYISGVFSGDGGEYSDRLFKYEPISGLLTNAVWGGYSWLDPATGLHSFMSAAPGDILYFFRTDDEPFRFSVFGRLPISPASSSSPHFSSIAVNPTNETVSLAVSPTDHTFDIFSAESTNVATAFTSEWTHLLRAPSAKYPALFSDSAPIPGKTKLFLASDATRDSDGDGLADAMESYAYGTSPVNPDTDGDGICDLFEIAWGQSPFEQNPNVYSWKESFEKPVHTIGNIADKNGWKVEGVASASVVEGNSFNGMAHLSVTGEMDALSEVSHSIDAPSEEIWIDVYLKNNFSYFSDNEECAIKFAVQFNGCLIATDGDSVRTNETFAIDAEKWNRYTMRVNNHAREWDIYVNGVMVFSRLKFHSNAQPVKDLVFSNGDGFVDELSITTTRPAGLSSDGDLMPDEWEISSFGNLLCDGLGDFDGDGLSDAEECAANTNPMLPDSDFDGIPDTWEVKNGLDPLYAGDAALDPDSDGLDNSLEFELGGDPLFFEVDPRVKKSGLYTEFYVTTKEIFDIPDFSELDPIGTFVSQSVFWQNGTWPDSIKAKGDYFACRLSGYVCIPRTGDYTFYVTSDDGSRLIVDGKTVTSDSAPHPARESSGTLHLEAGWRPLELTYYENSSVASLSLSWSGPDMPKSLIPSEALCHNSESVVDKRLIGFASGLEAEYYSLSPSVFAMPDFSSASPTASCIVNTISFPSSAAAWDGAPIDIVDYFAVRFAGYILIRSSGVYTFYLNSDDGSKLYIGSKLLIDNDGDHSMKKLEASIPLSKGLHPIFVEYYEKEGNAGLELTWCRPNGTVGVIPETSLFHAIAPIDGDMDEIPDWWEREYDLNPSDPADAGLDSDSDGLTNLEEFLAGSNPQKIDTDLDGMSDNWEVSYGFCPFINDAIEDPDSDGLVNVEEYRHGTNPLVADTDGDGCSDKTEIFNTRGNPLAKDILWPPVKASSSVAGSSFISSTGTWRTDEAGTVYAAERAGSLTWCLSVPEEGADALAVRIGQHNSYSKDFEFDLSLKVDGVFVTRELVFAEYGSQEEVYFFLPEIPHGEYEFTVTWHNWEVNTFLSVFDLRFVKFGGPDSNGDGIADWKNYRFANSSEMDALPCESLVSPLCVEGRDLWRDVLEIDVEYPETNAVYSTVKTIGDGFYADIPLPLSGTAIVSMKDRTLSESFPVVWKSFDVFTEEYATNALLIRAGDSLKIAPYQESESEITISIANGDNNWRSVTNWTASTSIPYCFTTNGLYLIEVTRKGLFSSKSAYALVDVVSSRFPKRNPAILMDMPQTLTCPDLSPRNILEYDSELKLDAEIRTKGVELSLLTSADRNLGMVSRLAEGGAISDAVQVTPIWADNGTYYRVAENYADGSQLIVVSLLFGAVAENMTIELEIFVSGVTFEDGSRFKTLTAKDLDENGHYTIRFIRARGVTTSVCHRTYIYQDGKLLYTNK